MNSEIARGLDVFELEPSDFITQNEIDAANTVVMEYKNAQGQPMYKWPASFAKAKAYVDQLERNRELDMASIVMIRTALDDAEEKTGRRRASVLKKLNGNLEGMMERSSNPAKIQMLSGAVQELAG